MEGDGRENDNKDPRPSGKNTYLTENAQYRCVTCVRMWQVMGVPVMNYGAEDWGTRAPKRLEKVRRNFGKVLIGASCIVKFRGDTG